MRVILLLLLLLPSIAFATTPSTSLGGGGSSALVDEGTYYSLDKPLATADGVAGENLLTIGANQTAAQVNAGSKAAPGAVGIWGSSETGKLHFVNDVSAGGAVQTGERRCAAIIGGASAAVGASFPSTFSVGGDQAVAVGTTPYNSGQDLRYAIGPVYGAGPGSTIRISNFQVAMAGTMQNHTTAGWDAGETKSVRFYTSQPGTPGSTSSGGTRVAAGAAIPIEYDDMLAAGVLKWVKPVQPAVIAEVTDAVLMWLQFESDSPAGLTGTILHAIMCFDLEALD